MFIKTLTLAIALLTLSACCTAWAQQPNSEAKGAESSQALNRVRGEVMTVDLPAKRLTVKTPTGSQVVVILNQETVYRRVAPGATSLEKAAEIKVEEITPGDQVLARGTEAEPKTSMLARLVVVMPRADILRKQETDKSKWLMRGILGRVVALNPETKEITLLVREREGASPVIMNASANVEFYRYAPDSVQFADAQPSSFAEINVGDQLRALGERSNDGSRFTPEVIVSGAFSTIAGTITGVDVASGVLKMAEVGTQQPFSVFITKGSLLRRLSKEMVKMLERNAEEDAARAGGLRRSGNTDEAAGKGSEQTSVDLGEMIERQTAVTINDLKPGEAILVVSTVGADASRLTAILVASGVGDLLKRQQRTSARDLNLGMGLPSGAAPIK